VRTVRGASHSRRRFHRPAADLSECTTIHSNLRAPRRFYTTSSKSLKRCGAGWQPVGNLRPIGNRPACSVRNSRKTPAQFAAFGAGWHPAAGWQPACQSFALQPLALWPIAIPPQERCVRCQRPARLCSELSFHAGTHTQQSHYEESIARFWGSRLIQRLITDRFC